MLRKYNLRSMQLYPYLSVKYSGKTACLRSAVGKQCETGCVKVSHQEVFSSISVGSLLQFAFEGSGRTMFSKISSQRTSFWASRRVIYLFFEKNNVPENFRRPSGKSMYRTGFWVSSRARLPCSQTLMSQRIPECIASLQWRHRPCLCVCICDSTVQMSCVGDLPIVLLYLLPVVQVCSVDTCTNSEGEQSCSQQRQLLIAQNFIWPTCFSACCLS